MSESTSPSSLVPSLGERPGDPTSVGPDDLRLAVDSAQSVVSGSRLISVQPGIVAGRGVWIVRLLTEGPGLKSVEVDAVTRGARASDITTGRPEDMIALRDLLNATKVFWPDAAATATRQTPNGILGSVLLDSRGGNTAAPVWRITVLNGRQQVEYTVDAVNGAVVNRTTAPRKPHDYG